MKFKIYKNFGVLGAEKKGKYTYGAEHPHADASEEINVTLNTDWKSKRKEKTMMIESDWKNRIWIN